MPASRVSRRRCWCVRHRVPPRCSRLKPSTPGSKSSVFTRRPPPPWRTVSTKRPRPSQRPVTTTIPRRSALRARLLVLRVSSTGLTCCSRPSPHRVPSAVPVSNMACSDRTGRMGEAVGYLQAVIDAGSGSRRALDLYRAGLAARALGRYRDTNALLRGGALASPGDPEMQTAWGELFLEKFNQPDAQQLFQEALTLDDEWGSGSSRSRPHARRPRSARREERGRPCARDRPDRCRRAPVRCRAGDGRPEHGRSAATRSTVRWRSTRIASRLER